MPSTAPAAIARRRRLTTPDFYGSMQPVTRYEKLERSFVALNHLAAAIIAFRKVPLAVNIIYG